MESHTAMDWNFMVAAAASVVECFAVAGLLESCHVPIREYFFDLLCMYGYFIKEELPMQIEDGCSSLGLGFII